MKLSDKERIVLAAAELRADAPISELRKDTGLREHTIRYALRRIIQRKVATPIPLINLQVLGMTVFNIFFSVGAEKRATKDALLKAFSQSKEVVWIGEFGGEFQYGIAVVGKHVGTALDLLNSLAQKYQNVFFEKSVAWQSSVTLYYRKYLTPKRLPIRPIVCRYTDQTVEIDEIDERVLSGLASMGGESHRQVAMSLKMPLSTFELRVRKLTERGVIAGHILSVDPTLYGMQGYKLLVYGKGLNAALAKGLGKFCEQHRSITYLIECIGSWDYEIGVEAQHPQEVTEVVQEIYEHFGALINNVKLLNKFSDVKIRWYF